ncbi:Putative pentatricopeptide repeat-containing protein [Apostasia shenzhenica]|uniref:Pentatricopeptide repeat-containing protein n=1 Tax=Apostasia shenzhenica TaxID=1088818 RepID=A0A2I0AT97_9ASPA|nr:Putative pentatricopeptide repeat-containing protein [Apostasia shenzhenica]
MHPHPFFSTISQLSSTILTQLKDPNFLDLLLQRCVAPRQAKQAHALILLSGNQLSPFLSARLVSIYSRLGLLPAARSVFFSAASPPSALLCNSMLRALLSHGDPLEAISLYRQARSAGGLADGFTFPLVLRACTALSEPILCASVHAHAVVMGFQAHLHVGNELVAMYGKSRRLDLARKSFDAMPLRTVVTWNVLISGYAQNRECANARKMFDEMQSAGPRPNPVTWTSILSAYAQCQRHSEVLELFNGMQRSGCGATPEAVAVTLSVCPYVNSNGGCRGGYGLLTGKKIHGFVTRIGFKGFPFVRNSLVCMYGKLGNSDDAEILFSEAHVKDLVSWNALISSYAATGRCYEAYEAFRRLEEEGDPAPNVVSWSAVIGGFASCGMAEWSLNIFRMMQKAGTPANAVTIGSVLSCCAELSAMGSGREIHAHSMRNLLDGNILVGNGLLHMYVKGGSLKYGCLVFERIGCKDLVTWNSMIAGYGMHGFCDEALGTFRRMVKEDSKPDGITFVAVLSACSHAGRVIEGQKMFDLMLNEHGITPDLVHYSCVVDLFGRAGKLTEANEFMQKMPMSPNACVWGALLNSCRIHGNATLAENAHSGILGFEGETSGNCMLISNIYAASGRWEDSARLRVMTREKGIRKNPGQSWIEVNKSVHVFSAFGSQPSCPEGAYAILKDLNRHMEIEN